MNERLAIVKLGAIGDVLHALPAAASLRRRHPGARIVWIVEPAAAPLLEGLPHVDRVLVLDTRRWRRELVRPGRTLAAARAILTAAGELARERCQQAFDLQGLAKSGLVLLVTRARLRAGLPRAACRERLNVLATNHRPAAAAAARHVVERNLAVVEGDPEAVRPEDFELALTPAERAWAERTAAALAPDGRPLALLNLGSGWPTKAWPPERFGQLARALAGEAGLRPVFLWGPGEEPAAARALEAAAGTAASSPPTGVREIYALAGRARLVVGCDTGPFHLAWAAGTPVVGLFGPTDPERNGPFRHRSVVLWRRPACSPCYRRACPDSTRCTAVIDLEPALAACRRLLEPAAPGPPAMEVRLV